MNPPNHKTYLTLLSFSTGLAVLGGELTASRLLAPYFGTSMIVWSSLIGLILLALALGTWIGGKQADRNPNLHALLTLTALAATTLATIPFAARALLPLALQGLTNLQINPLATAFIGCLTLLGLPMLLLGAIAPWALRIAAQTLQETGRIAGRLSASSTLGSFLGALLPSALLIPTLGTLRTFQLLSLQLLLITAYGFLRIKRKKSTILTLLLALPPLLILLRPSLPIKPHTTTLHEQESPYQYLQVTQDNKGWRHLHMNEGIVSHSKYHPHYPLTFGAWDYHLITPYFIPGNTPINTWAIIGAGAGTTARLIHHQHPHIQITGIELDPAVLQIGKDYFHPPTNNYHTIAQDGRSWIKQTTNTYDIISLDAYRQPYVPFELTTLEFFTEIKKHLTQPGAIMINVAAPSGDDRLLNALATTLSQTFPSIYILDLQRNSQARMLIGVNTPTTLHTFQQKIQTATGLSLTLAYWAKQWVRDTWTPTHILTDDHAPVEWLMDQMILHQIAKTSK